MALTLFTQVGCASSNPSRYYLLSAMDAPEHVNQDRGVAVGIGPIDFPKHLDRPQIVTRGSQNRLYFAEFDRWAEPLERNFAHVLAENLAVLLTTDDVVLYPWKNSARINYQIIVTVNRFDATMGGDMVLQARWTVLDGDGNTIVVPRATRIAVPVGSGDYESVPRAGSRALEELSRQIAEALPKLNPTPKPEVSN